MLFAEKRREGDLNNAKTITLAFARVLRLLSFKLPCFVFSSTVDSLRSPICAAENAEREI
ncbi:hypothetical protein EA462_06550 [Natrarchaeobius halalkaliphilus]|uniref:Uncharacterized protein n=1 Tax=Natrarchaeobius halalkaliphilus TaxID=1679091 RepID=A0A3N6MCW5_9EURY|nr:hypothetical protein EA462_06550 [Natrarchaeobius halalkaliphilus]